MEGEKLVSDGSSSEGSEDSGDSGQQSPTTQMPDTQVAAFPANPDQYGIEGAGGVVSPMPAGPRELASYTPSPQGGVQSAEFTFAGGDYKNANIGGTHNVQHRHKIKHQHNVQKNVQNIQYNVTNIMQPTAAQQQVPSAPSPTRPISGNRERIASDQQHGLEPETIQLPGGIIMYEKKPINRQSRIFRGKLCNKITGDIDIVIKVLADGPRERKEAWLHFLVPDHEQIVHRYSTDIFMYRGLSSIFMAMELCDRLNLQMFIKQEKKRNAPFDLILFLSFARQIVEGLAFLHRHNVMHRDLKPPNILLAKNRTIVKISDFGLSKHVTSDQTPVTQSMIQPGTDGWKPPEVLMNADRISTSGDIFSLALVVYHTLSYGEHPFGDNPHSWNHYIMVGQNLNLGGLRVPNAELAIQMLMSMLDRDPTKRPTAVAVLSHPFFKVSSAPSPTRQISSNRERIPSHQQPEMEQAICCFGKSAESPKSLKGSLETYDPTAMKWTKKESLHMPDWDFTAAALNDDIYVLMSNQQVHRLTHSEAELKWKQVASMLFDHGWSPPLVNHDEFIYVIGKCGGTNPSEEAERYDPKLDTWSGIAGMKSMKMNHTLAATKDHIYCIGGRYDNGVLESVERFDPGDESWSDVAPMKKARGAAAAAVLGSKIYVLGGMFAWRSVECYDPAMNTWTHVRNMYIRRSFFSAAVVNGRIFALGGDQRSFEAKTIEMFDPEKNQWEVVERLNNKIYSPASVVIKM